MLVWVVNKKNKTISLVGEYDEKYSNREGKDKVYINNCNDFLNEFSFTNFMENLEFNPFKDYSFKINNYFFEKNKLNLGIFPYTLFGQVYVYNEDTGKAERAKPYPESTAYDIMFLEELFHAFGYETDCRRLNYKIEKGMEDEGFKPAFYYGCGAGCCLFVKKNID